MANFFTEHWDVFLVYGLAILLVYIFRKRFEWQGIVALFRTKFGLDFMKRTGERHAKFWHILGLVSIAIGFLGMLLITVLLFYGIYQLIFVPTAPPVLSPVIPGVKIPGVPITFPLWYTLIALFFAVVVHEAAHGIFASAYKIRIKSSGFAAIGPLPGAFVEPDEKTMGKRPARQQLAILSGGPFSNVVLAIIALLITTAFSAGIDSLHQNDGVSYTVVQNDTAARAAGLPDGGLITAIDGAPILESKELTFALSEKKIGDAIRVTVNGTEYVATLGAHPDKADRAYLGVIGAQTSSHIKEPSKQWLSDTLFLIGEMFVWIYIISLGIGIANLIPAGPLDGGRMFYIVLQKRYDPEHAKRIFYRWSIMLLVIIIFLVFVPIIKAIV